jgi:hypothetical protein
MGMDVVLLCNMADGPSKGNRATTTQIDTEFPLLTPFFIKTLLAWGSEKQVE